MPIETPDGIVTLILKVTGSEDKTLQGWAVVRGAVHVYDNREIAMDFISLLTSTELEKAERIARWSKRIETAKREAADAEKETKKIQETLIKVAEKAETAGTSFMTDLGVVHEQEKLGALRQAIRRANDVLAEPCPSKHNTSQVLTLNLASGITVTIAEIEAKTRAEAARLMKEIGTMPTVKTTYPIQQMRGYKPIWGRCAWKKRVLEPEKEKLTVLTLGGGRR
jgi:hypothetical protein